MPHAAAVWPTFCTETTTNKPYECGLINIIYYYIPLKGPFVNDVIDLQEGGSVND